MKMSSSSSSATTVIEPGSPLYLHPSDGTNSVVVEKLLGFSNYRPWKSLWEELENLTDLPPITKWTEEIGAFVKTLHKFQDEQKLFQFLYELDEEACCAIQEESQRELLRTPKEEDDASAMMGETSPPVCTHCKKKGHAKSKCWLLHGFPSDNRKGEKAEVSENKNKGKEVNQSYRRGRPIRGQRGGRSGRGARKFAGNVQTHKEKEKNGNSANVGTDPIPTSGIPTHLIEELLKHLPVPSKAGKVQDSDDEVMESNYAELVRCNFVSNNKTGTWILDSGASHHMTVDISNLRNIKRLETQPSINLPTGDTAIITHKGEIEVSPRVRLKDIVYVPAFDHNLLSIHKLVKDNNLKVVFYQTHCIMQCRDTGKFEEWEKQSKDSITSQICVSKRI
ncbi:Retrovirus-related Pol polyprotein from transposon RE1 [Bienertia sinuspersici]